MVASITLLTNHQDRLILLLHWDASCVHIFCLFFLKAVPKACESLKARDWIWAMAVAMLDPLTHCQVEGQTCAYAGIWAATVGFSHGGSSFLPIFILGLGFFFLCVFFFFLFFFFFAMPALQHTEAPGPGIEPVQQQRQCWILNNWATRALLLWFLKIVYILGYCPLSVIYVANIFLSVSDLSFGFTFGILFFWVTIFYFYVVNSISIFFYWIWISSCR